MPLCFPPSSPINFCSVRSHSVCSHSIGSKLLCLQATALLLGLLIGATVCLSHPALAQKREDPQRIPSPIPPPQNGKQPAGKKGRTQKTDRHGRDTLVIDDTWQTLPAPPTEAGTQGWEQAVPKEAKDILVPSLLPTAYKVSASGESATHWYWRRFDLPANWKGQMIRLRFEAVAETAQVWLNGQKLGEHTGGATPFEFTVTSQAQTGASNLLAVRVTGGRWGTGLWQGVMLMAHDEAYLGDCVPQTDALRHLNAALDLFNTSQVTGDATLDAQILAKVDLPRPLATTNQNLHLTPGRNITTLLLTIPKKQTLLWTPANPSLYMLRLSFRQEKDVLDTDLITFGLREFGYQNGTITLNGASLQIKALPATTTTLTVVATMEDKTRLRNLLHDVMDRGVNVLYVNAPPPMMLRLADELGLLVIEGARPGQSPAATATELQELVRRDRAHPCILAWNLPIADPARSTEIIATLRTLDPTRFLLAGAGPSTKLWAPNENDPTAGALPVGLLTEIGR